MRAKSLKDFKKLILDRNKGRTRTSLASHESLTDAVSGLLSSCRDYKHEFDIQLTGRIPILVFVRMPDPAFFLLEHGGPFILSLLGERGKKQKISKKEQYQYQLRTVYASLVSPKMGMSDLTKLPSDIIISIYNRILDNIAPEQVVKWMTHIFNSCKNKDSIIRGSLLEIYLMGKNGGDKWHQYLIPSVQNPYVRNSLEKIVFEIGIDYDMEMEKAKIKASPRMF